MTLLYEEKVTSSFKQKVLAISKKLNINPNWLMAIMNFKSGLNHKASNKIGSTGLIHFRPSTAKDLGTSTAKLKQMSAVQQLDYVYKYYKPYKHKIKSFVDLYLTTFMPISVGKSKDWVFKTNKLSAELIAKQNKDFDVNKDKKITVSEVENYLLSKVPYQWRQKIKQNETNHTTNIINKSKSKSKIIPIAAILIGCAAGYTILKQNAKKNKKSA